MPKLFPCYAISGPPKWPKIAKNRHFWAFFTILPFTYNIVNIYLLILLERLKTHIWAFTRLSMFIFEVTATILMNFQKKSTSKFGFYYNPPPPKMTVFQLLSLNHHILVNMLEKIKRLINCVILGQFLLFWGVFGD